MISDVLLVRLIVSFMVGAVVVAFVTALADLYGEGPAGFMGGLPTAVAVNLLSIGVTQSTSAAVQATTLFPLGFGSTFAFLLFYTFPSKLPFRARMTVALGIWFAVNASIAAWAPDDFVFSVAGGFLFCLVALLARRRIATGRPSIADSKPNARLTALRGILGGTVVISVVTLSLLSGPLVGGVFSAAPAIWSSALYVTSRSRGLEFSRSLTWTFMHASILTVIPYGVAVRYFFPAYGIWIGTLLSYMALTPLAYLAWRVANYKWDRNRPS